jgi:hypothetical protein
MISATRNPAPKGRAGETYWLTGQMRLKPEGDSFRNPEWVVSPPVHLLGAVDVRNPRRNPGIVFLSRWFTAFHDVLPAMGRDHRSV